MEKVEIDSLIPKKDPLCELKSITAFKSSQFPVEFSHLFLFIIIINFVEVYEMFGKNWCLEAWSEITEVTKKLLFVVCKFVFSLGIFVVKFRYGEKLRDLKYGNAEWGINMCFIYSILIYS